MNKDSPPSPAEQAALDIADMVSRWEGGGTRVQPDSFAPIIQQAIDRSVAETEERIRSEYRQQLVKVMDELKVGESLIPKQEGEK